MTQNSAYWQGRAERAEMERGAQMNAPTWVANALLAQVKRLEKRVGELSLDLANQRVELDTPRCASCFTPLDFVEVLEGAAVPPPPYAETWRPEGQRTHGTRWHYSCGQCACEGAGSGPLPSIADRLSALKRTGS